MRACVCMRTDHVFLLSRMTNVQNGKPRALETSSSSAINASTLFVEVEVPKQQQMLPLPPLPRGAAMASRGRPCSRWCGGRCLNKHIAMQNPVPERSCRMQFEPPEPRSKSSRMNIAYDVVYNVVCDVVCDVVCKKVRYAGQNI
jgi:hypothetical protein